MHYQVVTVKALSAEVIAAGPWQLRLPLHLGSVLPSLWQGRGAGSLPASVPWKPCVLQQL